MAARAAFITGIGGQDGSYLAEWLVEQGYCVHGLLGSGEAAENTPLASLARARSEQLFLHAGAFEDTTHLRRLILRTKPDEFYHLADPSSARLSLELPEAAVESVSMATLRILEILRDLPGPPRFLYASSSEVFGSPAHSPQDELTPLNPTTPYGAAKALAQQLTRIYRLAYGLPTCAAILYNHESPRRPEGFVSRKVARAVARIRRGEQEKLRLGPLTGRRDWGWAPDYARGLWLMLQQPQLDDFVLATGRLYSVEELVEFAFTSAGLDWRSHVEFDPALVTPVEQVNPCGNPGKAHRVLGWRNTVPLPEIMRRMVEAELAG